MLNKNGERELAYLVTVTDVFPMDADRLERVQINGWNCVCSKGTFHKGDLGIFFEIDSKLPETVPFTEMEFLKSKHFKIKSQKIRGIISQGLLLSPEDFGWTTTTVNIKDNLIGIVDNDGKSHFIEDESRFLTKLLNVTYSVKEDNHRKSSNSDRQKYSAMAQRHKDLFKHQPFRWLMRRDWGKKLLFIFFGKKRDVPKHWPVGKFPGVNKTDQERIENMTWVLEDKTPFIMTQKCDGSSATYILERKKFNKFEFYVCSRNVRMFDETQESFHNNKGEKNLYWEMAFKYNIKEKMKDYLDANPNLTFVCWQGELCGPTIQKNPHKLKENHLFMFHWTDNTGRWNIIDAMKAWMNYGCEVVPIVKTDFILPDDLEEFKLQADGVYASSVCEGQDNCPREGFVYYKSTEPTFSFKNVSREYLLGKKE